MTTHLTLLALLSGMVFPRLGLACTCALTPLDEIFDEATILMVVEAGPGEKDPDPGIMQITRWPFEVVHGFKGEPEFEMLWSRGHGASCGASLEDGQRYLVSAEADGYVGLCTSWKFGRWGYIDARVRLLHAYEAGLVPALAEPWLHMEYREGCTLFHRLTDGGGELRFVFRSRASEKVRGTHYRFLYPDADSDPGFRPHAIEVEGQPPSGEPGFLSLVVSFPRGKNVREHSGYLKIGAQTWPTHRAAMEESYAYPQETVDEEGTREILAALRDATAVSIHWEYDGLREWERQHWPDYPAASATTPVLYFDQALSDFQDCVDRGVLSD